MCPGADALRSTLPEGNAHRSRTPAAYTGEHLSPRLRIIELKKEPIAMRLLVLASALTFVAASPHFTFASAQAPSASHAPQQTARPAPPTRDPHAPGYPARRICPTAPSLRQRRRQLRHRPHPHARARITPHDDVPNGTIVEFTMLSTESKFYPGIARDHGTFGTPDPNDPAS